MERMEEGKVFGTVGPIVKVKWYDAAAQMKLDTINGLDPTKHLAMCESVGELIVEDRKALILVQHWSDTDGVDILAIPKDWCQDIEVLKEVEECISENLESQQE